MNCKFLTIVICAMLMCHSCVRTRLPLQEGGYIPLAQSVVIVKRPGSMCTGFFISDDEILTAAHCLDPQATVQVYDVIGYRQYLFDNDFRVSTPFYVVEADFVRDVALLQAVYEGSVDYPHDPVMFHPGRVLPVGTRTISVGHPAAQPFTVTTGIVSRPAITNRQNMVTYLHSNAPIYLGNSGGPLFDDDGYLIGMANSIRGSQTFLGVFISYTEILEFLNDIEYVPGEDRLYNGE